MNISIVIPYYQNSTDAWLWSQMRKSHDETSGKWEFPGGKIEPGELPEEAAVREVREETSKVIPIESLEFFSAYQFESLRLHVFLFRDNLGVLFGAEEYRTLGDLEASLAKGLKNNRKILSDLRTLFHEFNREF